MAGTEVKNFDSPDEVRPFEGNGKAEVLKIGGQTVGRGTFEPGWRWSSNVKPIAGMHAAAQDVAHHEIVLRDLHSDLVTARRRDAKDLCCLLDSLAVKADAGDRRIVRDEVLRDVLVEDAPVTRLVVVDRLDIAP